MSVNAHLEHGTLAREPLHHHWRLFSVVGGCVAIDIAVIWYVVRRWDYVAPYVPWLLLAIGALSFFLRTRSLLRKQG